MFDILSRKLFGKNFNKLFTSLFISVIIYFGLSQLDYKVEVSTQTLVFINLFFSGSLMLHFLGSKDNGAYLKGFFAMPFNSKKFILEYAVVMGLYVLFTKTLLIYALIFAFTEIKLLVIITLLSVFVFVCLSSMIAYAFFKDKKFISVIILLIGISLCFLLPESIMSIIVYLLVSVIYAVILFFVKPYRFMPNLQPESQSKRLKKSMGGNLLVAKYILRYVTSNKSYMISPVIMLLFVSYMVYQMNEMGFRDGIIIGLALNTFNTSLAIIVSSNRGLHKKLNSLPNKIKSFFVPYSIVIFTVNIIFSVLLLVVASFIGTEINMKIIIATVIFPIQNAIGTAFLECTRPILHWRVETDLWHNPRKYIIPLILVLEAAVITII